MAFITGLILIDAPASALNMGKSDPRDKPPLAVAKSIRVGMQDYPYVSAQAFRYWLRETLKTYSPQWICSEPTRSDKEKGEKQQAFTEGDPIHYWDDDLLGYMRAEKATEDTGTLTRVSPFRTSTLVSISPIRITEDFGVMARHEGAPVIQRHEFYRTTFKGLFSLDLRSAGTFTYISRSGYLNLSKETAQTAIEQGQVIDIAQKKAVRLPYERRVERVQTLLQAIGRLEGGARQTLHYTDVSPVFVIMAITRGGNHPFGRIVMAEEDNLRIHEGVVYEAFSTLGNEILPSDVDVPSKIYVGRAQGFMDSADETLAKYGLTILHPRQVFEAVANEIALHEDWWE